MVPYSYNMVDMGGIDLAEANGTVVSGVYEKIIEAMNLCGDLILYNWKFAEIEIAPSAYTVLQQTNSILINGLIQVTELDQITVIGLPPPLVPVSPLEVTENGLYEAEPPASGFNPVRVAVPPPVITSITLNANGVYQVPEGVDGFNPVTVSVSGELSSSIGELFRHVMFSNSASDKVMRGDRWFQRDSSEPVIFLASASDAALSFTGYAGISFSANGITGTYSQHGDLVTLVSKTTPNGTPYYVQKMNGQYPPSVASGILTYNYGGSNYFFNYIPNSSTILYNTTLQDFIGSNSLIDSLNAFIDAMYQEYYA